MSFGRLDSIFLGDLGSLGANVPVTVACSAITAHDDPAPAFPPIGGKPPLSAHFAPGLDLPHHLHLVAPYPIDLIVHVDAAAVSYTHLTLPTSDLV